VDEARVRKVAVPAEVVSIDRHFSRNLEELVERRVKFLTEYQNEAYARRYVSLVEKVKNKEKQCTTASALAEAVARYYAKLLAYKDEYEVARLHADATFKQKIDGMFEGDYKVVYHLAPPLLAKPDPLTGEPKKMRFGAWISPLFTVLKSLKGLRGTALDPFGYSEERKTERALIAEYEQTVERLLQGLKPQNHALAVEIASLPEEIRGFGHIKARNVAAAREKREALLARYAASPAPQRVAA